MIPALDVELKDGDGVVFAWDKNREVRGQLLEAYPTRPVWIIDGPSRTKAGYAVIAGPLSTKEAIAFSN